MFIVPISRMDGIKPLEEIKKAGETAVQPQGNSFSDILKNAVEEADKESKKSKELDTMLATGELDNLHTALIQAEQSAAAIEFTTQLSSKAVNAYNQIMGMQI